MPPSHRSTIPYAAVRAAREAAKHARSPETIREVLAHHGLPPDDASVAAITIWGEARDEQRRKDRFLIACGWGFTTIGGVATLFTALLAREFVPVAMAPAVLGGGLLWAGYVLADPE